MWQDIVLTIANIALAYALVPQVWRGFKNKKAYMTLQTSLITSVGMLAITITYFTLNLFFATTIAGLATILWATLLIQRIVYR